MCRISAIVGLCLLGIAPQAQASLVSSSQESVQERVIHQDEFDKGLASWKVLAGHWESSGSDNGYVYSTGWGVNLLLLTKRVGVSWNIELEVWISRTRWIEILVWWKDADNWLALRIDGPNSQAGWTGLLNGNSISAQPKRLAYSSLARVLITRRMSEFTAVIDVEHRLRYSLPAAQGEGAVGFRCEGPSLSVSSFKCTALSLSGGEKTISDTKGDDKQNLVQVQAPFAVDPNDLDKLAAQLWEKCQREPSVKRKVEAGNMAIAPFDLIDIPSRSVALNVAEDLYTAMIDKGFQLVERGQLTRVLSELKIQDTAAIDAKTAQRVGQLTGASLILVGSISDRGNFVVINARLLETSTGRALVASKVEMRKIPIQR